MDEEDWESGLEELSEDDLREPAPKHDAED